MSLSIEEKRLYFLSSQNSDIFQNTRSKFEIKVDTNITLNDYSIAVKNVHFQSNFTNIVMHKFPHLVLGHITDLDYDPNNQSEITRSFKRYDGFNILFHNRAGKVILKSVFIHSQFVSSIQRLVILFEKIFKTIEADVIIVSDRGKFYFKTQNTGILLDENLCKLLIISQDLPASLKSFEVFFGSFQNDDSKLIFNSSDNYKFFKPASPLSPSSFTLFPTPAYFEFNFNPNINKPNLVYIECENIFPINHNVIKQGYDINNKSMAFASFQEDTLFKKKYCNISFTDPLYHRCRKDETIKFKLCDENGRQLLLDHGPPTLLSLSLIKKMSVKSVVHVSSKKSDYFTNNSPSHFICKLISPLDLFEKQIFLSSISISKYICNIYPPHNQITFSFSDDRKRSIYFEPAKYSSMESFLSTVNLLFLDNFKISINRDRDILSFSLLNEQIKAISLPGHLAKVFGLTDEYDKIYQKNVSDSERVFEGEYPFDINLLYPEYCFLYCDIVKTQYSGTVKSNLLKLITIPDGKEGRKYISFNFDNVEKVPCRMTSLDTITFTLTNQDGNQLYFDKRADDTRLYLAVTD